ncbi:MAG: phage portal protein [Planctomycetaceae bacterium]|jgi:lambda family phage portal protein|nr:phage portal protein [Planctomycetaceae bacterium]
MSKNSIKRRKTFSLQKSFSPNNAAPFPLRLRYDAAQTTVENIRHWSLADGLSADGSMSSEVRRTLRNRSRYEVANNAYARGLVLTLAATCVGTGPRLQILSDDDEFNKNVEMEFASWSESIRLFELLQTMRIAKITDGEAFAAILKNPKIKHPVEIDIRLIESDRVMSPYPTFDDKVDGITYDKYGNPFRYYVSSEHPGDSSCFSVKFSTIPADYMIHWYRVDRAGQSRGLPEIMPALPLFAQLRRYTLAVLAAAETAADFAAVLYTDAPANGEAQPLDPLDVISLEKRMATVMPDGWKLGQIRAEHPNTTYAEFKREILSEIGRCLQVPVNILLGDSSKHNYASGRLDHQTFFKSIKVEQTSCEQVVLNPIFDIWYRDAIRIGLFTPPTNSFLYEKSSVELLKRKKYIDNNTLHRCWFWDGMEHVDPFKEAKAASARVESRISNLAIECAKVGLDWEDVLVQAAREKNRMLELGLTINEVSPDEIEPEIEEDENEEVEIDESNARTASNKVYRRRDRR